VTDADIDRASLICRRAYTTSRSRRERTSRLDCASKSTARCKISVRGILLRSCAPRWMARCWRRLPRRLTRITRRYASASILPRPTTCWRRMRGGIYSLRRRTFARLGCWKVRLPLAAA